MNNIVTCKHCGKVFQTFRRTQKFCSFSCYLEYGHQKMHKRTCIVCGKDFFTEKADRQACKKHLAKLKKSNAECSGKTKENTVKGVKPSESKWWLDECPFHNGRIKEEYLQNMADWYFI